MSKRPRVLVIAEAANPEWASVPLVGWSLSRALAEVVDAHVVTQQRNRQAIERAGWREGVEFTSIDSEAVAWPVWKFTEVLRRLTGLGWTTSTALASIPYYYFEHLVWRRFGEDIRRGRFDIVHRVTPLSPTIASVLAHRCRAAGVSFLWGPLNGGVAWPREFTGVQRQEGEWLSSVRDVHRFMPAYRSSRADAAAILVGSRATRDQMAGHHDRCVYIPENGIDPSRFPERTAVPAAPPLRVAFVGRLVPYKGADMLVEAVAPHVRAGRIAVDIIGEGPQREALVRQIAAEGISDGVTLHGWVAHGQVQHLLARCHVLGFPSVREFGGGVVLEAMAMGVVPVVVDYAGPAELVTGATGYRVPLGPRAAIVERFRHILGELAEDPAPLVRIGERARRRVHALFTWEAKARQVVEVYRWILGHGPRPEFGMPFPDLWLDPGDASSQAVEG
jgi:glycosyltransferase involved in cell wall biosynthesis